MKNLFATPNVIVCIIGAVAFSLHAATYKDGYPDMNTAELGEKEKAHLASLKGRWKRPHYGNSDPKFKKDWDEITRHEIPEWLLDAKFGIYTHWGLFSIPAFRGNTYVRYMYTPTGSNGKPNKSKGADHEYHKKNFGDPTEFGYTDFVPMFTCEDFDGAAYVKLMQDTGAKFGGLCVVHHDGFLMWDSEVNRWNVGKMGPQRDIYGEFVAAARKLNFKTCATFHHARSWSYAFKDFDMDFYSEKEKAKLDLFDYDKSDYFLGQPGGKIDRDQFAKQWHDKIVEVIDKYRPDVLWFDGINRTQPQSPEKYVVDFLKHYYSEAEKRNQKVVVCNKLPAGDKQNVAWFNFPEKTGIRCYEGGRNMPPDAGEYWLTDRAISYPWSYTHDKSYNLGPDVHVRALCDQTARGGIYLLSLTPMASGRIHPKELAICKGIGDWLKVNGEAIYSTRRWKIPAEGPITLWRLEESREGIMWNYKASCKEGEFRFTQSKDGTALYSIMMKWPENGKAIITSLKHKSGYYPEEINSVELLGSETELEWKRTADGLVISLPEKKPCDHAYCFRIR